MTKLNVVEKAIHKGIEQTGNKKLIKLFNEYLELAKKEIETERYESYDQGYTDGVYSAENEAAWNESLKL